MGMYALITHNDKVFQLKSQLFELNKNSKH